MVDCTGFIAPLNLECLLVNTFAGSMDIFMYVAVMAIAAFGAYFRMLNGTMLIMLALFGIFMSNYMQGPNFLAVLIVGMLGAVWISKMVKQ